MSKRKPSDAKTPEIETPDAEIIPPHGEEHARTGKKTRPSEQLAFRIWNQFGRPSLRQLEVILDEKGYAADHTTLSRWTREYGPWAKAMLDASTELQAERIIAAIEEAIKDSQELAPEVFNGVKTQLVARLYETIKIMPLNTIDEWMRALDACERIEAFIHAERGKAIAARDPVAIPRGASNSLIARLNPSVNVAPFKRPNGTNGSGH